MRKRTRSKNKQTKKSQTSMNNFAFASAFARCEWILKMEPKTIQCHFHGKLSMASIVSAFSMCGRLNSSSIWRHVNKIFLISRGFLERGSVLIPSPFGKSWICLWWKWTVYFFIFNTSNNISGTTTDLVRNTRHVRTRREATDADVVQDLKLAQMAYVPVRNTLP